MNRKTFYIAVPGHISGRGPGYYTTEAVDYEEAKTKARLRFDSADVKVFAKLESISDMYCVQLGSIA